MQNFSKGASRTIEAGHPHAAPAPAHAVYVRQCEETGIDGTRLWGLAVDAVLPTDYGEAEFQVYARFLDAETGDWQCIGRCHALPVFCSHPILSFVGETIEISFVRVSPWAMSTGPEGGTKTTIVLASAGFTPPDVTGFTATPVGPGVLFEWTPITDLRDVLGYEIRAGAAGWAAATLVTAVAPINCPCVWVPRSRATGTSFYLKAKTRSEDYSNAEVTATITAAGAACLDASSDVEYQEVTILAGSTSVTVTTVCPYTVAPYLLAGASADTPLGFGWGTWAQNPNLTWSATLYSALAPTGGWLVILHGAGE